jgi:protein-S-isoprenylcysteine O-methyltransferase Ste14
VNSSDSENGAGLNRDGVKEIVRGVARMILYLVILLISAGRLDWTNAWVYGGLYVFLAILYSAVMIKVNPELLNERGGKGIPEGTKRFDIIFYAVWIPLGFVTLIVCGIDAGRYGWSHMSTVLVVVGVVMSVPAFLFSIWAMAVNPHFEAGVRVQEERDHKVCSSGPYRTVRHPGYSGLIVLTLCSPLILGSWWGLIPAGMVALLFIVRTALEDRTLRDELPGYAEYAGQVRYRLVPGLW